MINNLLIPTLIITPLLFGIFGFVFQKKETLLGLGFGTIFLILSGGLLYSVTTNSLDTYYFGGFIPPLGIAFEALPFGSLILTLSALILLVVFIYAASYLEHKQAVLFYPLGAFLALGFVVIYLSRDIFNIYVGLEITGLSAVGLSALQNSSKSIHSALIYLFATLVASGLYLLGVAIIYAKYALLDISSLSLVVQNDFTTLVAFGFMVIAFLIKTAVFPFSFWLPKAHANALSPVSALLSALVIKTTFYLLYLFATTLFPFATSIYMVLGVLGIVAIFYGGIKAFLATDLKILIAYSTVSQVGYLVVVFAFAHAYAYYAMVFTLLSHALAKSGLFLASGAIIHIAHTKTISKLQGYASIAPVAIFAIGLSSVSLIGLPPSLGFISKWFYLQSSFETSSWLFLGAILGGGILSALYLFKLLILFLQKPLEDAEPLRVSKDKKPLKTFHLKTLQWSAFSLSFLSVLLGFLSNFIIGFLG